MSETRLPNQGPMQIRLTATVAHSTLLANTDPGNRRGRRLRLSDGHRTASRSLLMKKDDFCRWREDYVTHVVPLMIWHVWRLARQKDHPVSPWGSLDADVDIYRLTIFDKENINPAWNKDFHDPNWNGLKQRMIGVFEKYSCAPDTHTIEAACMEFLWPLMDPRIEHDSRPHRKGPQAPFGCWRYDIRDEVVALHFRNAVKPESPFDDLPLLAADLLQLLKNAKETNPAITKVSCGTWLNNLPVFRSLFPSSWLSTKSCEAERGSGLGVWGQYMDRRGAFHHKNAQNFRATGRHPYFCFFCYCGYTEAVEHLEKCRGKTGGSQTGERP